MWHVVAGGLVAAAGLFLLGLGVAMLGAPARATRFLGKFASSARAHDTEQVARLIAGTALISYSPSMWLPTPFEIFGWVLVVTAAGLLLIPWTWHHRFAGWAIPFATRRMKLYGACSLALGALVLWAASRPVTG